jgi:hypothetical protein
MSGRPIRHLLAIVVLAATSGALAETPDDKALICISQDDVEQVRAVQRTPGLSMDIPRCTLFKRGDAVVVVNIEYGFHACGSSGNSCATVNAKLVCWSILLTL